MKYSDHSIYPSCFWMPIYILITHTNHRDNSRSPYRLEIGNYTFVDIFKNQSTFFWFTDTISASAFNVKMKLKVTIPPSACKKYTFYMASLLALLIIYYLNTCNYYSLTNVLCHDWIMHLIFLKHCNLPITCNFLQDNLISVFIYCCIY